MLLLIGASECLVFMLLLSRMGMGAGGDDGWVLLFGEMCPMVGMAFPSSATRGALGSGGSFFGSAMSTFRFNSPGSSRGMGMAMISFFMGGAGEVTISTGDG